MEPHALAQCFGLGYDVLALGNCPSHDPPRSIVFRTALFIVLYSILEYIMLNRKETKTMKNKIKKDTVQKREYIDCAVFDEVEKKYPKISKKGVAYDLGLTYVTFEKGYLEATMLRKLIKEYGAGIMAVIMFFRSAEILTLS